MTMLRFRLLREFLFNMSSRGPVGSTCPFVKMIVMPASGHRRHGKIFEAAMKKILEGRKLHVSFLRQQGSQHNYPAIEDESIVLQGEIEGMMPEPRFDQRGSMYFD